MKKLFLTLLLFIFSVAAFAQVTSTTRFSPGPPGGMTPSTPPGYAPPVTPVPVQTAPTAPTTTLPTTPTTIPTAPSVVTPASPDTVSGQNLATQKNTILQNMNAQITALQNSEQCVTAAADETALQACLAH